MFTLKSLRQLNKKRTLSMIWSVVALAWLGMAAALFMLTDKDITLAVVATVAVITEVAFWLTALMMGVAMVDARKAVVGKFTRFFRQPVKTL
ncbi:hypothetical protein [Lacimicrobium sp. SS2-24]|uniref:hypothetical protein n=1 Tax=Lacimicrobium sp. SS2-24 TaxID=2005569 RepID=UPI000B4ACD6F|nr:hypothetical protein [Lacimicrobium sp. SS2-24]